MKNDHVDGSWFLPGDHGSQKGGRVYCTVMALLCLEENYRHMRLFNNAIANQNGIPAAPPPNNAGGQPNNGGGQPNNAGGQPNNGAFPLAIPQGGGAAAPAAPAVPGQALPDAIPQQGGFGGENLPAGGPNAALDPGVAGQK
jgi:hypothetical protein